MHAHRNEPLLFARRMREFSAVMRVSRDCDAAGRPDERHTLSFLSVQHTVGIIPEMSSSSNPSSREVMFQDDSKPIDEYVSSYIMNGYIYSAYLPNMQNVFNQNS